MPICAGCGRESEGQFAFCPYCGAALEAGARTGAQRKTVTVLFCDVTGSTELGELTDPEALRALLARYFERMKAIVESHGGTVEKFIGDAVMAVFGVPRAYEDDALRAVRVACQMRDAFPALGVDARIGLNTGEVVTGTEERLVTGDPVNVAARLQQAARPGEILLGETSLALVREAVEVQVLEPLELKGKAEPVPAYRVVSVHAPPERRHDAPFVGRAGELDALREAWQRVCVERRCELVTVVADAGVGKSRLTAELLSSVDAWTVGGRCLPYGEGITYWPVVEVIKQLDALPSDPAAAASLRALLGETEEGTSAEEIAWAFRKLLEQQAHQQPLVCVFDDLHWGEETFLDLVEHVALLSTGAPILIVCLARPELVDRRREWPIALRLEPLPEADVQALIPERVSGDLRRRIARVSGGNPLFVTEMVAMASEREGDVAVPPTLRALLAARLDQLGSGERAVLERGAIEGESFHRGAVQALIDDGQVTPRLASLVRKGLIRPDTAQLAGEDAFRFRHILIRDAAYESIPKQLRASFHERLARWLEAHAGDNPHAYEELIGYHLEQAYGYWDALSQMDERSRQLGAEGARRLAASGRRALARADDPAAAELLRRAIRLLPVQSLERLELVPHLAEAIYSYSTLETHDTLFEHALETPGIHPALEARLRVIRLLGRVFRDPERSIAEVKPESERALPLFEAAGDDLWLAKTWRLAAWLPYMQGRAAETEAALRNAVDHARRAGDRREELHNLLYLVEHARHGTIPASEGLRRCDEIAAVAVAVPTLLGGVLMNRSGVLTMLGRFDEAAESIERGRAILEQLGLRLELAYSALYPGMLELARGNAAAAASVLEPTWDVFSTIEGQGGLARVGVYYARALYEAGRCDEAEGVAMKCIAAAGAVDVVPRAAALATLGRVVARRGDNEEGERLAREAIDLADRTDWLALHGAVLLDLADVLSGAGKRDEAARAVEAALERYERKEHVVGAARARAVLTEIRRVGVVSP